MFPWIIAELNGIGFIARQRIFHMRQLHNYVKRSQSKVIRKVCSDAVWMHRTAVELFVDHGDFGHA